MSEVKFERRIGLYDGQLEEATEIHSGSFPFEGKIMRGISPHNRRSIQHSYTTPDGNLTIYGPAGLSGENLEALRCVVTNFEKIYPEIRRKINI